MIPVLYPKDETAFENNGIGRLPDCIDCSVTEERNGIYELTFTYPVTGLHYSDIEEHCIVWAIHDDTKLPQPFEIYKRSVPINGIVTFNAHHISYKLGNVILRPFTAGSCAATMAQMETSTYNVNPFSLWTDKQVTGEFSISTPASVKEKLGGSAGSILDVYGTGEYEWDKWNVKLYVNRGRDTDVEIRGGKNLTNIRHDSDVSSSYNAVAPFWAGADETVFLPEGIIIASEFQGQQVDIKPVPLDLSQTWQEKPTVAQLRAEALRVMTLKKVWEPDENIEVDFVALWQTEEYKNYAPLQRVRLCDTVSVIYPQYGINSVRKKVIRVEYDVLRERYSKIVLGKVKTSFAKTIIDATVSDIIKTVPTKSFLDGAIDAATRLITGGLGGHVVIGTNADGQPNEILVMDTDDKSTAVNVLRINNAGIGFSTTGYNGPFTSAWTIDGKFDASFIKTGNLDANRIRTGIITDATGNNYWNLDTGAISIRPGSGGQGYVTFDDLEASENSMKGYADNVGTSAKDYADDAIEAYDLTVDNKITTSENGLRTEFSNTYSMKGDTVSSQQYWYYQSTSPTQLFGGEWSTTNPGWEEGKYLWQKVRPIKADGTAGPDSPPVCITGNTGKGIPGDDGEDAIILVVESDTTTSTPKESSLAVNFVAKVRQGGTDDIDPNGITYRYAWFTSSDTSDLNERFVGAGKTYSLVIDSNFCDNKGAVWAALVDEAYYTLTNGNTSEPITSGTSEDVLEVA